ncbi:beta ketoadipyl CoA thiolase, th1, partial [Haplosporangium gracile]
MASSLSCAAQAQCIGGLYTNPQCCAPDVLGVACLDGGVPSESPRDAQHFREICGKAGKAAKCCVIPVAGQDVL